MIRTAFWFLVWLASLGTLEIYIRYADGLEITFHNAWRRNA